MNSNPFVALTNNEMQASESTLDWLNQEISKAPYAAGLYLQRALVAHQLESADFEKYLNQAAARTLSRARLKELLEGPFRLEIEWLPIPPIENEAIEAVSVQEESEISSHHQNEHSSGPMEEETVYTEPVPPAAREEVEEPPLAEEISVQFPAEEDPDASFSFETIQEVHKDGPEVQMEAPIKKVIPKNEFGFSFVKVKSPKPAPKEKEETAYQLPATPLVRKKPVRKPEDEIIDSFLEKNPALQKIDFGDREMVKDDLAKKSGTLAEEIVTENMAMIYMKQKNFQKALQTFKKLQLKFPEKSDYFAALIKNLENQNTL